MTNFRGANKKGALNRREALKLLLAGATGIAFLKIGGLGQNSPLSLIEAVSAAYTGPTYTIQQVGSIVKATPASGSGLNPISGSDAATVIMGACVPNSKVLIKAGTYIINRQYGVPIKNSNVELYGDGSSSTILRLAAGINTRVLGVNGMNNVNIHDLQIDGNRMNQSQASGAPAINHYGISSMNSTGLTVQNCYVHDCRAWN